MCARITSVLSPKEYKVLASPRRWLVLIGIKSQGKDQGRDLAMQG